MTTKMVQSAIGNDPGMFSHLGAVVRILGGIQTWGLYSSSVAHHVVSGGTVRHSTIERARLMDCKPTASSVRRARRLHGGSVRVVTLTAPITVTGAARIPDGHPRLDVITTGEIGMRKSPAWWLTEKPTSNDFVSCKASGVGSTARTLSTLAVERPVTVALCTSRSRERNCSRSSPIGVIAVGSAVSPRSTSITSSHLPRAGRTPSATCARSAGLATARSTTRGPIRQRAEGGNP